MKISIVLPVYNAEKYLEECINSVLGQTCSDWELIIVNDGSTDGSSEICNKYANNNPDKIFVFHKENEGQFMTRLFGIKKCSGDYICFLDADDFLENNSVITLKEQVSNHNNPDVVCFGFCNWDGENKEAIHPPLSGMFDSYEKLKKVYEQIINGKLPGALWSKAFKNELLKSAKINDKFVKNKRYGEDAYHSFSVLANAKSVLFLDNILYRYRANPQGASQGFENRDPDYFNTKYVSEVILNIIQVNGMNDREIKEILYARNFNETVYYMLKYYRSSPDAKRRKAVVEHNWSEYLLDGVTEGIKYNKHIRKPYIRVWNAFEKKKHFEIYLREKFRKVIGW